MHRLAPGNRLPRAERYVAPHWPLIFPISKSHGDRRRKNDNRRHDKGESCKHDLTGCQTAFFPDESGQFSLEYLGHFFPFVLAEFLSISAAVRIRKFKASDHSTAARICALTVSDAFYD
jgi:hypothetical protein